MGGADPDGARFFDEANHPVKRRSQKSQAGAFLVDKGNHRHFMLKKSTSSPKWWGARWRIMSI